MKETPSQLISNKHRNKIKIKISEISGQESRIYESEQNNKANAIKNYENRGTGKYIPEGTIARLKALPYNIPENIVYEGDITSYHNGYYDRGTRALEILVRNGQAKIDNIEITPENYEIELRKIAINDGMNPEMDFDSLPEIIRFKTIYAAGFMEGQLMAPSKKSGR